VVSPTCHPYMPTCHLHVTCRSSTLHVWHAGLETLDRNIEQKDDGARRFDSTTSYRSHKKQTSWSTIIMWLDPAEFFLILIKSRIGPGLSSPSVIFFSTYFHHIPRSWQVGPTGGPDRWVPPPTWQAGPTMLMGRSHQPPDRWIPRIWAGNLKIYM
jgi:hypothetical protein